MFYDKTKKRPSEKRTVYIFQLSFIVRIVVEIVNVVYQLIFFFEFHTELQALAPGTFEYRGKSIKKYTKIAVKKKTYPMKLIVIPWKKPKTIYYGNWKR